MTSYYILGLKLAMMLGVDAVIGAVQQLGYCGKPVRIIAENAKEKMAVNV